MIRGRWIILAVAIPVLLAKLWMAAYTLGSTDLLYWGDFVSGEKLHGPVGIYAVTWGSPWYSFYNHPPLMGYVLWVINLLQSAGVSYRFSIRAISSLADIGSAYVLFALVRRRRTLREATWAGACTAASPMLFWVSGFHGNTDQVFTFLTFVAVWLLVDGRRPGLAGVVIALAVGIKIIPLVVIPALAVYAWRTRRADFYRFIGLMAAVLIITWGPALIGQFHAVLHNVIGYGGTGPSGWGILQLGHWLGDPWWVGFLAGPGRSLSVLVAAVVPAIAVWRRPQTIVPAVAWSLIAFLAVAVSFGVQYSVWPLIACYVIGFRWATVYNIVGGVTLTTIYHYWGHFALVGPPANFHFIVYQAFAHKWSGRDIAFLMVLWLVLLVIGVSATRAIFPREQANTPERARRLGSALARQPFPEAPGAAAERDRHAE